jgi:hypothetical protein
MGVEFDNSKLPFSDKVKLIMKKTTKNRKPNLKFSDLNIKTATNEEIDNVRIKSYNYAL